MMTLLLTSSSWLFSRFISSLMLLVDICYLSDVSVNRSSNVSKVQFDDVMMCDDRDYDVYSTVCMSMDNRMRINLKICLVAIPSAFADELQYVMAPECK